MRSASSSGSCFSRREPVAEDLALDERHGEPELAGGLARVVDGQDVRVLQPGGEADLALEALGAERVGQLGVQHLERDGAVVPDVVREIDRRHAAAAELALDRVVAGETCLKLSARVGQRSLLRGGMSGT